MISATNLGFDVRIGSIQRNATLVTDENRDALAAIVTRNVDLLRRFLAARCVALVEFDVEFGSLGPQPPTVEKRTIAVDPLLHAHVLVHLLRRRVQAEQTHCLYVARFVNMTLKQIQAVIG